MRTKFILHGGFTPGKQDEDNREFYSEILKDSPEKPKILLVCFAKDEERVIPATTKVMAEFNKNKGQNELFFEVASEGSFVKQVESADIVYLHGGISLKLLDVLKRYPHLGELFKGKIIAGESAGANVLGQVFYSPSSDSVSEGLGLLPVKVIPHYSEQYKEKLDNIKPELETLALPEYQFKVFYSE